MRSQLPAAKPADDLGSASSTSGQVPIPRVDRRVLRSRRAIVAAFDRLLRDRPLEAITVSAIAQEANVDRKTFYQHFGTIDGLLDAIAEEHVTRILDRTELMLGEHVGGFTAREGLAAFFEALGQCLSDDFVREQGYLEHVHPDIIFDRLLRHFERQVVARGLLLDYIPADEVEGCLAFALGGMLSAFRWWLREDRADSVDELLDLIDRLLARGLEGFAPDAERGASVQK